MTPSAGDADALAETDAEAAVVRTEAQVEAAAALDAELVAELDASLATGGDADEAAPGDEAAPEGGEPVLPEGATLLGALEAVLLVANEPLELSDFTALFGGCSWVPVRRGLRALQRRYQDQDGGLELVEVAKGWRLCTRPAYAPLVERVATIEREERLSRAQLEVLAVVAYRQPVKRADVDAVRGADSSASLKALVDKGLVRVAGRADQLGRPLLYGTSRLFLERFGLKDLAKLPRPSRAIG